MLLEFEVQGKGVGEKSTCQALRTIAGGEEYFQGFEVHCLGRRVLRALRFTAWEGYVLVGV